MAKRNAIVVFGLCAAGTNQNIINKDINMKEIEIHQFNRKLLQLSGSSHVEKFHIQPEWFEGDVAKACLPEAIQLIEEVFAKSEVPVLKSPLLVSLFPFWKKVFKTADVNPFVMMIQRDPFALIKSISSGSNMIPESETNTSVKQDFLVVLRYILDSETYSRDLPRIIISFNSCQQFVETQRLSFIHELVPELIASTRTSLREIDTLFQSDRQSGTVNSKSNASAEMMQYTTLLLKLQNIIACDDPNLFSIIDAFSSDFERIIRAFAILLDTSNSFAESDHWTHEIINELKLNSLDQRVDPYREVKNKTALFISNVPNQNIGQVFRVKHLLTSLTQMGCKTHYYKSDNADLYKVLYETDLVVVFRSGMDTDIHNIIQICHQSKIPTVYSVDDVIFEPAFMKPEIFAFLLNANQKKIDELKFVAQKHQEIIKQCDAALATTESLATHLKKYCPSVYLLPNMIDKHLQCIAEQALEIKKRSEVNSMINIGFAAGTSTHDRNFLVASEAIIEILETFPNTQLTIIGPVQFDPHLRFAQYGQRVILKPKVSLEMLFDQMNQFDINLAPLEVGNPFCETKSELRYIFASLLEIPTIASPVEPLKMCISDGHNGYLAYDNNDWRHKIATLVQYPELRLQFGRKARTHALAKFGPDALNFYTKHIFSSLFNIQKRLN